MAERIGREFMLKTRHKVLEQSPQSLGVPQPPVELPVPEGATVLPLPPPDKINVPAMELRTAIEQRRSLRRYNPAPLSQDELAYLLWLSLGVRKVTNHPITYRNVPSAGARHAFETYLLINRVEGIAPGLYRYGAIQHQLISIKTSSSLARELAFACLDQTFIATSAVTFFWVAVTERMTWRYVQRGYRYLHLDAGHVCENLYLAAEAIGSGACAIAAFDDDMLNATLGLDGDSMFVIYAATVGKK